MSKSGLDLKVLSPEMPEGCLLRSPMLVSHVDVSFPVSLTNYFAGSKNYNSEQFLL